MAQSLRQKCDDFLRVNDMIQRADVAWRGDSSGKKKPPGDFPARHGGTPLSLDGL